MMRTRLVLTLLALPTSFALAHCGGAHNTKLRQDVAYQHPEYPYTLEARGTPEAPAVMLSADWKNPSLEVGTGTFEGNEGMRPRGPKIEQHYDWDDDGTVDHTESLDKYDVRLVHGSGAVVSIRAVPVPKALTNASLAELAEAYLASATHQGESEALFNPEDLMTAAGSSFEIAVLDEASCRVSGVEAYRIEIVGHRTLPTPSPERRTRLVVVRPGYKHRVMGAEDHEVQVMLVAAYTNAPETFGDLEDDFNEFLNSWVLGGYGAAIPTERLGHTCQP